MVPKDDMGEKPKEQKEALQESLSLTFTEHNGVVAAYTNVRNTVECGYLAKKLYTLPEIWDKMAGKHARIRSKWR